MVKIKFPMESVKKKTRLLLLIQVFFNFSYFSQACPLRVDKIDKKTLTCGELNKNDLYCFIFRLDEDFIENKAVEDLISLWTESKEVVSEYKECRYSDELTEDCYLKIDDFSVNKFDLHNEINLLSECSYASQVLEKVNKVKVGIKNYGAAIGVQENLR